MDKILSTQEAMNWYKKEIIKNTERRKELERELRRLENNRNIRE